MPRSKPYSALFVVLLAVAGGLYTVLAGNQPLLGLDLQGGVSVVLQPTEPADDEALDQSLEILRSRVDALGVAEPEIARQGDTIVVDLPGIKEQQRALSLVGQTAELRFRPVLFDLGPVGGLPLEDEGTVEEGDEGPAADPAEDDGTGESTTTTAVTTEGTADEESLAVPSGRRGAALPVQTGTPSTAITVDDTETPSTATTVDDTATTSAGAGEDGGGGDEPTVGSEQGTIDPAQLAIIETCSQSGPTPPEEDEPGDIVRFPDENGNLICLGPTLLTGESLETATALLDPLGTQWTVNPVFQSGADGIDAFNAAAARCFVQNPDPTVCPSGRLAIVLDRVVVSSPTINAANFARDQIVISGQFTEESARDLAAVLRFGALPVELETQAVQTVSATIGSDVLRAGLISGAIGLALVAVYLITYYRLAALVAIAGLVLAAVMLWSVIAWLGEEMGLALTLGGVVGLIVSIGVAADSNIVYFENIKELHQAGRRLPTAVERAYKVAISTIVKAGVVSLIAAGLLYWLTVGAVRGFAFYLGLATLFDLLVSWLFMRPALMFLVQRGSLSERPDLVLGVRSATVGATPGGGGSPVGGQSVDRVVS